MSFLFLALCFCCVWVTRCTSLCLLGNIQLFFLLAIWLYTLRIGWRAALEIMEALAKHLLWLYVQIQPRKWHFEVMNDYHWNVDSRNNWHILFFFLFTTFILLAGIVYWISLWRNVWKRFLMTWTQCISN